jgi:hypothetical protein
MTPVEIERRKLVVEGRVLDDPPPDLGVEDPG